MCDAKSTLYKLYLSWTIKVLIYLIHVCSSAVSCPVSLWILRRCCTFTKSVRLHTRWSADDIAIALLKRLCVSIFQLAVSTSIHTFVAHEIFPSTSSIKLISLAKAAYPRVTPRFYNADTNGETCNKRLVLLTRTQRRRIQSGRGTCTLCIMQIF